MIAARRRTHPRSRLIRLSEVEPQSVVWLWNGYVPLGAVTVLDGDPGLGKSTLLLDLASRLSRGSAMPDGSAGPSAAGTMLLSAEDDLARVIRPRLDAAGADPDRVSTLRMLDADGEECEPTLDNLREVENAVGEVGALLVVVDPFMAYLPPEVDAHRDHDVRRSLTALRGLAERTGAAVVVIRHLNKSPGGNPLYRGGGSIGIIGAARSGLLVAAEPEDSTGVARVLAMVKSNLGPTPPSLRFRLVTGPESAVARVSWDGVSKHTAASLLAPPPTPEDRHAGDHARDFLRDRLATGAVPAREVFAEAKAAGIAEHTLKRAAQFIVVKRKMGRPGETQLWTWELRGEDPDGASKGTNDSQPGPLREREPLPSTCDAHDAEGGQAWEADRHTGAPGPLREGARPNSARSRDMAEGYQQSEPWPHSEALSDPDPDAFRETPRA